MDITIIEANENMCNELAQVKKQVWNTTYRGLYPDYMIDEFEFVKHESKFKNYIDSTHMKLYVAMIDKKIIGYTAIGTSLHHPDSNNMEILLLYLLKEFQGMRIGKKIFNFAKQKNTRKRELDFAF